MRRARWLHNTSNVYSDVPMGPVHIAGTAREYPTDCFGTGALSYLFYGTFRSRASHSACLSWRRQTHVPFWTSTYVPPPTQPVIDVTTPVRTRLEAFDPRLAARGGWPGRYMLCRACPSLFSTRARRCSEHEFRNPSPVIMGLSALFGSLPRRPRIYPCLPLRRRLRVTRPPCASLRYQTRDTLRYLGLSSSVACTSLRIP
ncbi:hypothetical protein C8Q77DRAFT_843797 [Trametes polyzona]|nr:hypothetical protein C8Q77DRAFT_843797 [Trametes polyzona]